MKFEDALMKMREGKKIRHPHFEIDEYLQACRVGLKFTNTPLSEMPISIVKMKGEYQHPDMLPIAVHKKDRFYKSPCHREDLHKFPQLNLLLIMSDDWEILE